MGFGSAAVSFQLSTARGTTSVELAHKLAELEQKLTDHDGQIGALFDAIRALMTPSDPSHGKIGFRLREARARYGSRRASLAE